MEHNNAPTTARTTTTITTTTTSSSTSNNQHVERATHPNRRSILIDTEGSVRFPKRQKSLVRPERERVDQHHRQYHYRQRATHQDSGMIAPSMTGNHPLRSSEEYYQQQEYQLQEQLQQPQQQQQQVGRTPSHQQKSNNRQNSNTTICVESRLERRPTASRMVRRGRSILGRERRLESTVEDHHKQAIGSGGKNNEGDDEHDFDDPLNGGINYSTSLTFWEKLPDPWLTYCYLLTCCFPGALLSVFGIQKGPAQTAWREKIGLLSFILLLMAAVGFLTFGFTQTVCPTPPLSVQGGQVNSGYLIINGWAYLLADWNHHPAAPNINASSNILYPPINAGGYDASFLFQDKSLSSSCSSVLTAKDVSNVPEIYFPCRLFNPNQTVAPDPTTFSNTTGCHLSASARSMYHQFLNNGVPNNKGSLTKAARVYYDWEDITPSNQLAVYNGDILNLGLLKALPTNIWNTPKNGLISQMISNPRSFSGKDISHSIVSHREGVMYQQEAACLSSIIKVGSLDTLSLGCISSDIVLYVSLVVILGVILTKFSLAMIFGWCLSWKLGNFNEGNSYSARMKREAEIEDWAQNMSSAGPITKQRNQSMYFGISNNKRKTLFPQTSRFTQPRACSTRFDTDKMPTSVWKTPTSTLEGFATRQSTYFGTSTPSVRFFGDASPRRSSFSSDFNSGASSSSYSSPCPFPLSPHVLRRPPPDYMPFNFPLAHTVCLVTCYSEGEEGLRTTLDSIAVSDYPNSHKVLLVICDGIITGSGNDRSTPDICLSMMKDLIVPEEHVAPSPYIAIADGSRRNNMAKVYAGFYKYDDTTIDTSLQQRVPMVIIVKCGTPEEASTAKPGNRGKRDSQIILMQFMQKVMFDERMTVMEYELFNSLWRITGVAPDVYEICLMVDADTKLYPDALSRLISCAVKDPEISGMCGETKIANKTDSWVAMIQVFEYYISHHQSKAFESIFGIVTCLPGCFCMYRIKAPKGPDGYWVPILANPDIVEHYSENVVDTLHKKNLLLLGEDRYLSTLMLRTFPSRKMMFVPQAVCKTVVPDSFGVLLSQRRRWINSTIHNLMELLFVHELCGTFCFSMQFVLFMELVGTTVLPAALSFTIFLVVMACIGQPAVLPLILLAMILGLPAVLIMMTSRKVVYVCWMFVYLLSLPIWNFVLPVYAYWHFDDFSWGDTRKVEGSDKKKEAAGHGDKEGDFDSSMITMKKWSDYEKDRRTQLAMERNLPPPRFLERPRSTMDICNIAARQGCGQIVAGGSVASSSSNSNSHSSLAPTTRTDVVLSDPPSPHHQPHQPQYPSPSSSSAVDLLSPGSFEQQMEHSDTSMQSVESKNISNSSSSSNINNNGAYTMNSSSLLNVPLPYQVNNPLPQLRDQTISSHNDSPYG